MGALETAFVTVLVWSSGYFKDDYLFLLSGRKGGFGEAQLTRSVFGSLVPGFQFGYSVLASFQPVPRWPAIFVTVVLYALSLYLFFRLTELLVGSRPILILLMAIAGLSGVLAISLVWWTASLNSLPAVVFDLLALDGLARHAKTGKRRYLVVSVVSFALGIAFYDASASFLAVLVVFTALYLVDLRRWQSLLRGFSSRAWLWAGYAVPIALSLAWRSSHPGQYSLAPLPNVGMALRFMGAGWAQGFVPSILGFTFTSVSQGLGRWLLVVVGQVLFFGVVFVSVYLRRDAWRAWALFGGGFIAIEVIAAIGRAGDGTLLAINTVYWTAQPFLLSIAIALAFLPVRLDLAPAKRQPVDRGTLKMNGVGMVALVTAAAVVCGLGIHSLWSAPDRSRGAMNDTYVQNLRQSWSDAKRVGHDPFVWNTIVPSYIVGPLFLNRISQTAGLIVSVRIDGTTGAGYLAGESGRLVPAIANVVSRADIGSQSPASTSAVPSGAGSHSVGALCITRQSTARIESVALNAPVPSGNWFLRLTFTHSNGFSTVVSGESLHFTKGSGAFLVPDSVTIGAAQFSFSVPAGATTCITEADFEAPVARAAPTIGPTAPTQLTP